MFTRTLFQAIKHRRTTPSNFSSHTEELLISASRGQPLVGATSQLDLVQRLTKATILTHPRAITAMSAISRSPFVGDAKQTVLLIGGNEEERACDPYDNKPQTLGYGASISTPQFHGEVLQALSDSLSPGTSALDIGTGTGYLACVFAHMVGTSGQVTAVDCIEPLIEQARKVTAQVMLDVEDQRFDDSDRTQKNKTKKLQQATRAKKRVHTINFIKCHREEWVAFLWETGSMDIGKDPKRHSREDRFEFYRQLTGKNADGEADDHEETEEPSVYSFNAPIAFEVADDWHEKEDHVPAYHTIYCAPAVSSSLQITNLSRLLYVNGTMVVPLENVATGEQRLLKIKKTGTEDFELFQEDIGPVACQPVLSGDALSVARQPPPPPPPTRTEELKEVQQALARWTLDFEKKNGAKPNRTDLTSDPVGGELFERFTAVSSWGSA